jgi:ABC-2 type transport system permease protein
MLRNYVVTAVFKRNFSAYFRTPTGYVFIAVFIVLAAVLAFWPDDFFVNNLANLDTLNKYFPYLLLFFVPAVAMGAWSEERKQGTDELLLTLPATDLELVVGKYLAALAVYGVAIFFSLLFVGVLGILGRPDAGVMLGTYLGYMALGGALLSVGMVASHLTSSMTVAFILGAVFCALPVFMGRAETIVPGRAAGEAIQSLGVETYFHDFASGVLSIQAVLYFVSITVVMLYANLLLLARRHYRDGGPWLHAGARVLSILAIAVCLGVLLGRAGWRADLTNERLHSLTAYTKDVLKRIDPGRPVFIHAYVSREVPQGYVQPRQNLLSILRDVDAIGGDRVEVRLVETEPYSAEAREAQERWGIKSERVVASEEGVREADEMFMGVAFTSGTEEVVVPFLHRGLSAEYEVARSIGTVLGAKRKRVGIAGTDAKLFGGFEFATMSQQNEWLIVSELKKQYDVASVALEMPVNEKYDCLIVALPSSLTQAQMDNLLAYMKKGNPTILFDDPMPYFNPSLSPDQPKPGPGRGGMAQFQPPPEPKGNLRGLLDGIGISWNPDVIAWDTYNPYPRFRQLPREFVFLGPGSGNKETFNTNDAITSGLQGMVLIFPGELQRRTDLATLTFTPLVVSSRGSGIIPRSEVIERSFFGMGFKEFRVYRQAIPEVILAARVEGKLPGPPPAEGKPPEPAGELKYVFVADLDGISDVFFRIRQEGDESMNFDNVTFVLNCVDSMAGDNSYVELRKRRPKHRTLELVESKSRAHQDKMIKESKDAEEAAKKDLDDAQKRLNDKVNALKERKDIDPVTRDQMVKNLEEVENRRLEISRNEIEDKKKAAIELSKTTMMQAIKAIRKGIRLWAVILPALVAVGACVAVFFVWLSGPRRVVA